MTREDGIPDPAPKKEIPPLHCKTCNQKIESCAGCGSITASCGDPVCESCMKKRK